jgi:hypothetical protein
MTWDSAAEPRSWTWTSPEDREARNVQIMEWWELGVSREEIARRVDLTPARISQIVHSFGYTRR